LSDKFGSLNLILGTIAGTITGFNKMNFFNIGSGFGVG